jgi:hypothetical protein
MRITLVAGAIGAIALTAGCGGAASQNAAPTMPGLSSAAAQGYAPVGRLPAVVAPFAATRRALAPHPMLRGGGWLSPAASRCKNKLFVSTFRLNYVSIYCERGHNQAPIGQITDGIDGPEGEITDANENLYVANADGVAEYAPGTIDPSFTYSTGLGAPTDVAVDSKGNVYVSNVSPSGSVVVFPQGSNTPSLTITGVYYPIGVALDAGNNLYVTYETSGFLEGQINEYAPGTTTGTNLGITIGFAGMITIDSSGDIVTTDQKADDVAVYPPGATQPSATFGNSLDPVAIALSHDERSVYVGDSIASAVYVYHYPSGKRMDTISDGVDQAVGVALSKPAPL